MERRAKIVATLGPASRRPRVVAALLRAGADVVRLNLSHGTHDEHRQLIGAVRRAAVAQGRHIPILADLMGPRFRLGRIGDEPRQLKRRQRVTLGDAGTGVDLPLDPPEVVDHLQRGERVLIDNGLVELRVESKRRGTVVARVVGGGPVATRKGVNLPETDLPFTISDKDRADIAFAVAEGADYLGVSFVGAAADLEAVRRAAADCGGEPPLVAKLERAAAIDRLAEIVAAADALMVARGDLGVEVPLHRVPVLQKRIVAAGRATGTPVIVATQMLESMMERRRPTRAEATDVANAVLDGADALMLSGETAAGRFPLEAVRTMARIIEAAEGHAAAGEGGAELLAAGSGAAGRGDDPVAEAADVVCAAAVVAAERLGVRRIVAFSQGGFTARATARYRPAAPILVFTTDERVARRVQLVWGVRPLAMEREVDDLADVLRVVDRRLLSARLVRAGEPIVVLMGDPIRERPLTNLLRVHRVAR